jgi:hypothetical protein
LENEELQEKLVECEKQLVESEKQLVGQLVMLGKLEGELEKYMGESEMRNKG